MVVSKTDYESSKGGRDRKGRAKVCVKFLPQVRTEQSRLCNDEVGVDCREGPPVPIPNTEVKLVCADDSVRVTACENR